MRCDRCYRFSVTAVHITVTYFILVIRSCPVRRITQFKFSCRERKNRQRMEASSCYIDEYFGCSSSEHHHHHRHHQQQQCGVVLDVIIEVDRQRFRHFHDLMHTPEDAITWRSGLIHSVFFTKDRRRRWSTSGPSRRPVR